MNNIKAELLNTLKKYFVYIIVFAVLISSVVTIGMKMKNKSYYVATSQVVVVSYNNNQTLAPNIVELTKTLFMHDKIAKELKLKEGSIESKNAVNAPEGNKVGINADYNSDVLSIKVISNKEKEAIKGANVTSEILCEEGKRLYKNSHFEIVGKAKEAKKMVTINMKRIFATWFIFSFMLISILFTLYNMNKSNFFKKRKK